MASISPTITTTTPGLQVGTSVIGLTYAMILEGLGPVVFQADDIYYKPSSIAQLGNPIQYMSFDINGEQKKFLMTTPVNPRQFNPSWWLLKKKNLDLIFDGQQTLNFNLLAGAMAQFYFYGDVNKNRYALDAFNLNNFEALQSAMGRPDFFKDYAEAGFAKKAVAKPLLLLSLANNTAGIIPVSILQQGNPHDISNATTRYRWDITGISYSNPAVSLITYPVGSTLVSTIYAGTLQAQTAQGLVDLLNSFNAGGFLLETVGPNTYITTYSDTVVYGDLSIGAATTSIAWSNTSADSTMQVLRNLVVVINSNAPPQSGSVSVSNGDVIDGSYAFGVVPPSATITISRTLKLPPFTTNVVYTDNGSAFGGVIPTFIIDSNYNYTITLTTP